MLVFIIKQVTKIVVPTLLLYVLLLGASFYFHPTTDEKFLHPNFSKHNFLLSPEAYLTYRSPLVNTDQPSAILIGASNVAAGFQTDMLNPNDLDVDFHNMSLGGMELDTADAMVRLIYANRAEEIRKGLTLIIGVWYGVFSQAESSHERTRIAQQMKRFTLYEAEENSYRHTSNPWVYEAYLTFLRPFFLTHGIANGSLFRKDVMIEATEKAHTTLVCNDKIIKKINHFASRKNMTIEAPQFQTLVTLSQRVKKQGGRLVIIDMPLPDCLISRGETWADYQEKKKTYFEQAVQAGATYWNFQDLSSDGLFSDMTHPNQKGMEALSQRLLERMKELKAEK